MAAPSADDTAVGDSELVPEPTIAEVDEIDTDSKPLSQEHEVSFDVQEYAQVSLFASLVNPKRLKFSSYLCDFIDDFSEPDFKKIVCKDKISPQKSLK